MRGWKCLFVLTVATNLALVFSQSQDCHQPGWTSGITICFRLVHKPSSFQGAKEECQSLSGSLLTLDQVDEVMTILGTSMVGNGEHYRIDGWLNATWMERDNQTLELNTVESSLTLVLNVEDGKVSGSWSEHARLGFICQKGTTNNSLECPKAGSNHSITTQEATIFSSNTLLTELGCDKPFLWCHNFATAEEDLVPYTNNSTDCECMHFNHTFTSLPQHFINKKLSFNMFSTPPKVFWTNWKNKWFVYQNNQWDVAFDVGENKRSYSVWINQDTQFLFTLQSVREAHANQEDNHIKRVSFDSASNTYKLSFESSLPSDIDETCQPVFYEPLKKIYLYARKGAGYFLSQNGSTWNYLEKIPEPSSVDSEGYDMPSYIACQSTIYFILSQHLKKPSKGRTFDANKFANGDPNPWGPLFEVPFHFWSSFFCHLGHITINSESTFLTVNLEANVSPKVEVMSNLPQACLTGEKIILPSEFVKCVET